MSTIYDIAKELGLSHTTVSKTLRGLPVKKSTRERVLMMTDKLGYCPNKAAIQLKTGQSRKIALLVPEFGMMQLEMIRQLDLLCCADGYEIIQLPISKNVDRMRSAFDSLLQGGYDGAIIYLYNYTSVSDKIRQFLKMRRPIVLIGPPTDFEPTAGIYPITIDNSTAIRDATNLLLSFGHRNIVHVVPSPSPAYHDERPNNIIKEMLIKHNADWIPEFYFDLSNFSDYLHAGYYAASELMRTKPETTAVQCPNDFFACGLIRGLKEMGIKVPDDISVVGSDNSSLGEFFMVSLTTIDMKHLNLAQNAWEILSSHLKNNSWEKVSTSVTLRASLIVRESTGTVKSKTGC